MHIQISKPKRSAILVVQGEGRGHLTQAITVAAILAEMEITVAAVVVGGMPGKEVPTFFCAAITAPVFKVISPGFVKKEGRGLDLLGTALQGLKNSFRYLRSLQTIHDLVRAHKPDFFIGFYEPMFALYNLLYRPALSRVSIAHQYVYLHEHFHRPAISSLSWSILRSYSRFTAMGSDLILALSLEELPNSQNKQIRLMPPLLRRELKNIQVSHGNYLLVYLVNAGYMRDIIQWHKQHPGVQIHCFTDSPEVAQMEKGVWEIDATLSFHRLDGMKFLTMLAGCKAVCATAGFETVAEAIFFNKPIMVVPVGDHMEQQCNARDVARLGIGIMSTDFNLSRLLEFTEMGRRSNQPFIIDDAEAIFKEALSLLPTTKNKV